MNSGRPQSLTPGTMVYHQVHGEEVWLEYVGRRGRNDLWRTELRPFQFPARARIVDVVQFAELAELF